MSQLSTIERFWYTRSKFAWLFWPFHLFFLLLVKLKRGLYKTGLLNSFSFDKPVLVVGNISIGGTGKTPFINQLVRLLIEHKIKVGIVSRGYRAMISKFPHQVKFEDSAELVGDEAYMQFRDLNTSDQLNIPIVIDPIRSNAVKYLIDENEVDIVISDDGLQHYQMGRELEILLFDGERQFGNQMVLPFGPLREPMGRLKNLDLVVQNGVNENHYSAYKVFLESMSLVNLKSNQKIDIDQFEPTNVTAIAGIGNPKRFYRSLSKFCNIQTTKFFADHHAFKKTDFDEFTNDVIIMTEKDASKCTVFAEDNWYYLKVEMKFSNQLQEALLENINRCLADKQELAKHN